MANLSEDIQCASFDTQPPMLDRTDFASWQQCIRLYCQGKENGVNILKSIDEGPFQMGIVQETLTEGASYLGPEQPRVYSDLSPEEKDRYNANIRATNILLQGLPKDIYTLINHYTDANDIWDNVKMLLEDKMLLMQAQENGVALDEEQILFLPDDYDAFDFDVDEAPTAQTMFMANLSSADHVFDEVGHAVPGVQSNVASIPNDAYMMIYNDMYEPHAQSVSKISQNTVVDNSLTAELATYKEQVELYERRAKFELKEREQRLMNN
nr:integrase, catalytic region, zinc finger, CCHC-type, peptidase aspartic, catalytic [Tanacetum cinerariifolium]